MRPIFNASLLIAFCMMGCANRDGSVSTTPLDEFLPNDTWVAMDPVQCLGNPWEQDWLESHDWDYEAYPGDPSTPELEPAELEIITDYYLRQGVTVLGGETSQKDDTVCLACACPLGYTLYLLVPSDDTQTMLDLGFRLESPALDQGSP